MFFITSLFWQWSDGAGLIPPVAVLLGAYVCIDAHSVTSITAAVSPVVNLEAGVALEEC